MNIIKATCLAAKISRCILRSGSRKLYACLASTEQQNQCGIGILPRPYRVSNHSQVLMAQFVLQIFTMGSLPLQLMGILYFLFFLYLLCI
jgi:hypothetical protein